MLKVFYILLLLVGLASLCVSQSATFNINKLITALDKDGDKNITMLEVEYLFTSSIGSNVTGRCRFIDWFVNDFDGSPIRMSVFFDITQSADKQVSATDMSNTLLGSPSTITLTVSNFTTLVNSTLNNRIDKIIAMPADFTAGYTFKPYNEFQVSRWADKSDVDNNGNLTRLELSAAMRLLDEDGDWYIKRCEYINSMTLYMQHSVTSSKVYDVIFNGRDINWADVDSDFLAIMMGSTGGAVTKQQFIAFFTRQNLLAAGLAVAEDGSLSDGCDPVASFKGLTFVCVTSSVLVLLNRFRFG